MRPFHQCVGASFAIAALLALTTISLRAAATLTQLIEPAEVHVGDPVIVTLSVQGGSPGKIQLPAVEGLAVGGTSFQIKTVDNNGVSSNSVALNISLTPTRAGDFTIPAFDLTTQEGEVLHVKAMKLHVLDTPAAQPGPAPPIPVPVVPPAQVATTNAPFNPHGPVVMPPANAVNLAANPASPDTTGIDGTSQTITAPRDKDGGPAKVFIIITPETTDAYVGQSIPLEIDFYIRLEVDADQNSLPTIKGSDFLMNSFTTRGRPGLAVIEGQQYAAEVWNTAISAPKSGDFPLSMERDTYWIKSITTSNVDPFFGGFFTRHANLAHELINSNQMTIHVHALPSEGQPAHFTGAIGHFQVTGEAHPLTVDVGDPVTLRFDITGDGNFDYVRCPSLPDDPAWKAYVPKSGTRYLDASRFNAIKAFEQSVIPQKNGTVPLPTASFSYFDPTAKQYVSIPIALPPIKVTGFIAPPTATPPDGGADSNGAIAAAPSSAEFLPNRLEMGSPRQDLAPIYRNPWFWAIQGTFVLLPFLGALPLLLSRSRRDDGRAERALRLRSREQEEAAMAEAVRQGDALAFFLAARHAIQLQLGAQWKTKPEAITLGEIRTRDPHLAETLAPLFVQADEVIYSGQASPGVDLAQWEQRVLKELLQPEPVQS